MNSNKLTIFVLLLLANLALLVFYGTWRATSDEKSISIDATERQAARKKVMDQFCATHSYKTKLGTKDLQFIIVDDEHKILYCTIPKVGSTTWKKILGDVRRLPKDIRIHHRNLWRWLYQHSEEERSKILQSYFEFVFVREPLYRLLSAFKNKLSIGSVKPFSKSARVAIVKAYRPQDFHPMKENLVNFSEFIQFFSRKNVYRNPYWHQYEELCHPCVIKYDFIGHLETLEEDAALVLKRAGVDNRVSFPPVHKSTGTSEVLTYYSKVPPQYITQLGESYRRDFEMFGYDYLGSVHELLKNLKPGTGRSNERG